MVAILTMIILRFDEANLERALTLFSARQLSAFAAAGASRLVQEVQRLTADGESVDILVEAHDSMWQAIETGILADTTIQEKQLLNELTACCENPTFKAAVFEDACAATMYAIRSIYNNNIQNAVWSVRRAYETADRYAASLLDIREYNSAAEDKILRHPAVQRELKRQIRDIALIAEVDIFDPDAFVNIRSLIVNERISDSDEE